MTIDDIFEYDEDRDELDMEVEECDVCDGSGECSHCDGTGTDPHEPGGEECESCGGSGECQNCDGRGAYL